MSQSRTECEAKLRIDDVGEFRRRLEAAGGRPEGAQQQHDTLYDFVDRRLTAQDAAFRLRRTGRRALLTYKGPPQPGQFKQRAEYETPVGDAEALELIAAALGLTPTLAYTKTRETWRLGLCEVCLDAIPQLGAFVEIEGPDPGAVGVIVSRLGLDPADHIPESYPQLLAAHCAAHGLDPTRLAETTP